MSHERKCKKCSSICAVKARKAWREGLENKNQQVEVGGWWVQAGTAGRWDKVRVETRQGKKGGGVGSRQMHGVVQCMVCSMQVFMQ